MSKSGRVAIRIMAASVMIGIGMGLGFGWHFVIRGWLYEEANNTELLSCAMRDSAFVPASSYGNFIEAVDSSLPRFGQSSAPSSYTVLPESRGMGFFSAVALQSPYIEENEAYARSWGYLPGEIPFLPLTGSIVANVGGLLEVYQVNRMFPSEDAAGHWMKVRRISKADALVLEEEFPTVAGDEMLGWETEPQAAGQEKLVGVSTRVDAITLNFRFQGGAELTLAKVVPYVVDALARVQATCRGEFT